MRPLLYGKSIYFSPIDNNNTSLFSSIAITSVIYIKLVLLTIKGHYFSQENNKIMPVQRNQSLTGINLIIRFSVPFFHNSCSVIYNKLSKQFISQAQTAVFITFKKPLSIIFLNSRSCPFRHISST